MRYSVSCEGIAALRKLAASLLDSAQTAEWAAGVLQTRLEENGDGLGPHAGSIARVLGTIRETERSASEPVQDLSNTILEVADAYEEIIDCDRYGRKKDDASETTAAQNSALGGSESEKSLCNVMSTDTSPEAAALRGMGVNRVDLTACLPEYKSEIVRAVKAIYRVHPELMGQLSAIVCKEMGEATYASYGPSKYGEPFGGVLHINSVHFSDPGLKQRLFLEGKNGWSTPNASPASVITHELGHGLHLELCALDCGLMNGAIADRTTYNQVIRQYMDDVHAETIVEQACADCGVAFDSWEFAQSLTRYGASNYGEAIAEAVAEVGNSPAPRPLAAAIYARLCAYENAMKGVK